MTKIQDATILIIATHGFEQSELEVPRDRLRSAGAHVDVASPDGKTIRGWDKKDWGHDVEVDNKISDCNCADYDALVIPGGVINPDKLRTTRTPCAPFANSCRAARSWLRFATGRGFWCRPMPVAGGR
jgi:protease I